MVVLALLMAIPGVSEDTERMEENERVRAARMLVDYFEQVSVPRPFLVRRGTAFQEHRDETRRPST